MESMYVCREVSTSLDIAGFFSICDTRVRIGSYSGMYSRIRAGLNCTAAVSSVIRYMPPVSAVSRESAYGPQPEDNRICPLQQHRESGLRSLVDLGRADETVVVFPGYDVLLLPEERGVTRDIDPELLPF